MKRIIQYVMAKLGLTELRRGLRALTNDVNSLHHQLGHILHQGQTSELQHQSLNSYGFSVWSQTDEDGILNFLVTRLNLPKPRCLEIGAGNFLQSNFRYLAEIRNASVYAVDAREDLERTVRSLDVSWLAPVIAHQEWITPDNIADIISLAKQAFGSLDLVSIDLDGNDYWVLSEADLSDVSLVMVEANLLFGSTEPVSIPRNDRFSRFSAHHTGLYWGASLSAWVYLLQLRGFRLVGRNTKGFNAFFVRDSLIKADPVLQAFAQNASLDSLGFDIREGRDDKGLLTYKNSKQLIASASTLPVVNVIKNEILTVGDLLRTRD
jgi:hypothetical protein